MKFRKQNINKYKIADDEKIEPYVVTMVEAPAQNPPEVKITPEQVKKAVEYLPFVPRR